MVATLSVIWSLDQVWQPALGATFSLAAASHNKKVAEHGEEILISERLISNSISDDDLPISKKVSRHDAAKHGEDHYSTVSKASSHKSKDKYADVAPAKSNQKQFHDEKKMMNRGADDNSPAHHQKPTPPASGATETSSTDSSVKQVDQLQRLFRELQARFVEQVIRQRVADKDHLLMEKWLVDNINDLHRELKQTELDFEHYIQVTKNILAQNEQQLRRQLARQTSLPLSIAIHTSNDNYATTQDATNRRQLVEQQRHHYHIERLLLGHTK